MSRLTIIAAIALMIISTCSIRPALADPCPPGTACPSSPGATTQYEDAGADALISWMGVKDSRGVPVDRYDLTLNEGGYNHSFYGPIAGFDHIVYYFYRDVVCASLWLMKFGLGFEWLEFIAAPVRVIGNNLKIGIAGYDIPIIALALLILIAGFAILAGKTGSGFAQLGMGFLIYGLVTTVFANPIADLIGPDGYLAQGRDTGFEIAHATSGGQISANGTSSMDKVNGKFVDALLRNPTLTVNFGTSSIPEKCQDAWSDAIKHGKGDKIKDSMAKCDSKVGGKLHDHSMGNPGGILVTLLLCFLLSASLVAFAGFFVYHLVASALHSIVYAGIGFVMFPATIIPGRPQTFGLKIIFDSILCWAAMVLFTGIFGAFLTIFANVQREGNALKAIFLTSLVLVGGIIMLKPARRLFDRARDNLAVRATPGQSGSAPAMPGERSLQEVSRTALERARSRSKSSGSKGARKDGSRSSSITEKADEIIPLLVPEAQVIWRGTEAAHEHGTRGQAMTEGSSAASKSPRRPLDPGPSKSKPADRPPNRDASVRPQTTRPNPQAAAMRSRRSLVETV